MYYMHIGTCWFWFI